MPPAPTPGPTHQHYTQVLASSPLEDLRGLGRHPLYLFLGCGLGVGTTPGGGDHRSPPTATPPARHLPEKILFPPLLLPEPVTEWGWAPWLGGRCQLGLRLSLSQALKPMQFPAAMRHSHVCLALYAPSQLTASQRFLEGEKENAV